MHRSVHCRHRLARQLDWLLLLLGQPLWQQLLLLLLRPVSW
jgi:hypothetical protein